MIAIKAIIMAGGKGTRLKPLTCSIPKPMVPILNKPVMEYTIHLLKDYGVNEIGVTIAYLSNIITDYFDNGEKWGVNLNYFIEDTPLGTGGSIKNAEEFIEETFIVISGDALTDINIKEAVAFHKEKKSKATLILKNEAVPIEYGVIVTDEKGKIIRFLEKPSWGEVFSNTINTGIYILEPEVLGYYKKGDNFDFSKDLFPKLLRDNIPMYGYVTEDYWCDIGDLRSYKQTQYDMLAGKTKLKFLCREFKKGIWVDEGTHINKDIHVTPPVYIGKNCTVKTNIDAYSVIGDDCTIEHNTSVKRSILWKSAIINENVKLSGTIICNNVEVKKNANIYENSVIGEECIISEGAVIKPDIKIWPHKKVEENTVVNQNLIWGTKASRAIFGHKDVSGAINIDITPEFASRLGSAFASTMKGETAVVVSADDSNASNVIKNALISGIQSTGARVISINNGIMPINRFAVRYYKADGGIHVRADYTDINKIHMEFAGKNGANINRDTEREIENLISREDFKRSNADRIKEIINIENFSSLYIKNGISLMKYVPDIKKENPSIVISSKSKNTMKLALEFLKDIGCQVIPDYTLRTKPIKDSIASITKEISNTVMSFGAVISENGEDLIFIDETGRTIEEEKYYALITLIVLKNGVQKKLVLPYTFPDTVERMAKSFNTEVIRTKSNPSSIMNQMLEEGTEEEFLLQYILSYNAIWGIGLIIDFLVRNNMKLSNLVDELPEIYFIRKEIECDWKDKGRIIREIIVENKDKNIETFEGVKICDDKGWALILPDSERPVFNVYTEGHSEEYAQELSLFFSEKVKHLLKNQRQ